MKLHKVSEEDATESIRGGSYRRYQERKLHTFLEEDIIDGMRGRSRLHMVRE